MKDIRKKKSSEQESRVAKLFKGRVSSRSGAGKYEKGDVHTDKYLIECKTSIEEKESYSIKRKVLDKVDSERREMGLPYYIQAFSFGNSEDFYILPTNVMKHFLCIEEELNNLEK